ncbi:hypothetical protein B0I32_13745 [Nonomuraea fuscirosea]|uniref:Uncharacterized protein n=1 Tax=Nonomuraea fuscirosea TaxID=1291556 RepID=A0A2T0M1Y1_9ACTN|nr:hypothetical protein [Nonomuraea fuscirosea]PRX50758.1 hypothetical protein B0I32_13745 [Nonomuraea fuscirosea]
MRTKIVLGCADGKDNKQSLSSCGCGLQVAAVPAADGLIDEACPGRPPSMSVVQVERVVVATLEETPAGAMHWIARLDDVPQRIVGVDHRPQLAGV